MLSIRKDLFVHVIGVDFDDCLLPQQHSGTHIDIAQLNKFLLFIWLRMAERAYAATYFYSSSNRQSEGVDRNNRHYPDLNVLDDPTSSFLICKKIAEQWIKCTFWSYTQSDAYAERPFGYSHARALLRATDDTAYHPGYVFDEHKFSLIYAQAHHAANNMRNCDFLSLKSQPEREDLMKLPFKSNAAFIYIQSSKKLLYVNKAQHLVQDLKIKAQADLEQMCVNLIGRIRDHEHDFEMFCHTNILIQGITLSDTELNLMQSISGILHEKMDWPIIFDFYDDREDILRSLSSIYNKLPSFLPGNLILRLNLYSANSVNKIQEYFSVIGTGNIDTNPGESVVNMAKIVLQKNELVEDDFLGQHSFSEFIEEIVIADFFKNRMLAVPTLMQARNNTQYAPHMDYSCILFPHEISTLRQFIIDKKTPSTMELLWSTFFKQDQQRRVPCDPIVQLIDSLLRAQTENRALIILNKIFHEYYAEKYLKTVGKDSDVDILLRKIHDDYNARLSIEHPHKIR